MLYLISLQIELKTNKILKKSHIIDEILLKLGSTKFWIDGIKINKY